MIQAFSRKGCLGPQTREEHAPTRGSDTARTGYNTGPMCSLVHKSCIRHVTQQRSVAAMLVACGACELYSGSVQSQRQQNQGTLVGVLFLAGEAGSRPGACAHEEHDAERLQWTPGTHPLLPGCDGGSDEALQHGGGASSGPEVADRNGEGREMETGEHVPGDNAYDAKMQVEGRGPWLDTRPGECPTCHAAPADQCDLAGGSNYGIEDV